jgi:hypothetical protein
MSVPKNSVYAWPESVAFKRMMRGLIRGQEYVPPQQPIGEPPDETMPEFVETAAASETAGPSPRPAANAEAAAISGRASTSDSVTVGDWTLLQNDRGDLVARHASGQDTVLASNPSGGTNG